MATCGVVVRTYVGDECVGGWFANVYGCSRRANPVAADRRLDSRSLEDGRFTLCENEGFYEAKD